jgi:hypothetical protein
LTKAETMLDDFRPRHIVQAYKEQQESAAEELTDARSQGFFGEILVPGHNQVWGGNIDLSNVSVIEPRRLVDIRLVVPVTMTLAIFEDPVTGVIEPRVTFGSKNGQRSVDLVPGVHVLFGDALRVDVPRVAIGATLARVRIDAFAAVCFAEPSWSEAP